jgi:DNA repair exonuclease SbcCD ATPase subunit
MANHSEKLGYKDFFDEALFNPVIENIQTLIATLKNLQDAIKSGIVPSLTELRAAIEAFNDSQKGGAEQLRNVAINMDKTAAAAKAYKKIQEEVIRLTATKKALESEAAKEAAKLRLEIKEATKTLKMNAQAATSAARAAEALELAEKALRGEIDASVTSYHHLSDALDTLRERYKSLVLAGQANTEEAARLRDAIAQLDSRIKKADAMVGQFQRNVGNYAKSFKEAMTEFLGASGQAGEAVLALTFAVERARDAFIAAGGGVRGFFRAIVEGSKALRGVGVMLLLEGISKLLSVWKDREALENAERKLEFTKQEIQLSNQLASIKLRLEAIDENTLAGLAERGRLLEMQAQKEIELIRLRRKAAEEELKRAEQAIEDEKNSPINRFLNAIGTALAQIVKMLAYIPKGLAAALSALGASKAAEVLDDIASKAMEAASGVEKFFASFGAGSMAQAKERMASLLQEISDLENQEAEIRQRLVKAQEEIAEKRQKLIEDAIKALTVEVESTATARQKLAQEYEKKFQALKSTFDQYEALLAGETEAVQKLRDAYNLSLEQLRAEMLQKDMELIQEAIERIDKVRRDVFLGALDAEIAAINERFNALRTQLEDAIKELGEDAPKYLEEVGATPEELFARLEEKRQRAIRKAMLEAAERMQKLREEIEIAMLEKERERFETEEEFARYKEKRLAEIQIKGAEERLKILRDLYEATGDEVYRLEIARAEAAIAQANARLKEIALKEAKEAAKVQQEIVKEYIRAVETLANSLSEYLRRIEENQQKGLQRQQEAIRRRISIYEGLAKEGALAAEQSIAELEAREAEIIRKQEELKKKAQRREMALAAIKTYVQLLDRNAPSPLAQTIRDITAITQFVAKLPTFFHGTEFVKAGVRIPGAVRDALIVRVHEGERIVPANINRQLGGIKNEDLPKLIQEARQMMRIEFDYDSLSNTIVTSITEGNRRKKTKRRL